MKHFYEILSTLGATDIANSHDNPHWSLWKATYRTPAGSVSESYLYLKSKCPVAQATSQNKSSWMSASSNQGYVVIVTPKSNLARDLLQTQVTFGAKKALASTQLLQDNILLGMTCKQIPNQDYFIDPDIELENGKTEHGATKFLAKWLRGEAKATKNVSLAVLVADGGVGKTTVARMLCHHLQTTDSSTVPIMVESDQWRNLLQATVTMDAVWDSAISRRFEQAGRLLANGTALRVLIREGIFVVIFDGFDELCLAPGSHFRPGDVVTELIRMATPEEDVRQARVVVTSRSTYWNSIVDEIEADQLEVFRLKGFDNEQRKKYFKGRLKSHAEMDLAFRISKEIGGAIYDSIPKDDANENRPSGVPFILDLIAQYVENNNDASLNPYLTDPFENLLENICKRENRRQTLGMEPLQQFQVFEEMFREFQVSFRSEDLAFYLEAIAGVSDPAIAQRFSNHVFLTRIRPEEFGPKYEVLSVYFIARFLANSLVSMTENRSQRSAIARVLAGHKTGKTQVIDWLEQQVRRYDEPKRLAAVHHAIKITQDKENRGEERDASMAIFHLICKLVSPISDKGERTEQLGRFFKADKRNGGLQFQRLAVSDTVRAFNFENTSFVKCWFDSVDFRNCRFSDRTIFKECTFEGTLNFSSCEGANQISMPECTFSMASEITVCSLLSTPVRLETKRHFAEDALTRALRKFKGAFGFNSIQFQHRTGGFKKGNPYNQEIWTALEHHKIVESHHISNVADGGLNIVENKDVRREIGFFFDNGVLGARLNAVILELVS